MGKRKLTNTQKLVKRIRRHYRLYGICTGLILLGLVLLSSGHFLSLIPGILIFFLCWTLFSHFAGIAEEHLWNEHDRAQGFTRNPFNAQKFHAVEGSVNLYLSDSWLFWHRGLHYVFVPVQAVHHVYRSGKNSLVVETTDGRTLKLPYHTCSPDAADAVYQWHLQHGSKQCSACGAMNKLDAQVCAYCGTPLKEDEKQKGKKEKPYWLLFVRPGNVLLVLLIILLFVLA